MFTGIIQDIGTIHSIERNENFMRMGVHTKLASKHLELGASIACNGCCLTIVNFAQGYFVVDIGPETLALTRFSQLRIGDKINLEPALRVGDALGGHQVSGHVDNVFPIHSFEKLGNDFWKLILKIPNRVSQFVIPKGSISVAGISLTVAKIVSLPNDFRLVEIMIIPHTFENTILQFLLANPSEIEVEFDQSTKAIASLLENMILNYTQMQT